VFDNLASDELKGGGGQNLFFAVLQGANRDKLDGVAAKDKVVGI